MKTVTMRSLPQFTAEEVPDDLLVKQSIKLEDLFSTSLFVSKLVITGYIAEKIVINNLYSQSSTTRKILSICITGMHSINYNLMPFENYHLYFVLDSSKRDLQLSFGDDFRSAPQCYQTTGNNGYLACVHLSSSGSDPSILPKETFLCSTIMNDIEYNIQNSRYFCFSLFSLRKLWPGCFRC